MGAPERRRSESGEQQAAKLIVGLEDVQQRFHHLGVELAAAAAAEFADGLTVGPTRPVGPVGADGVVGVGGGDDPRPQGDAVASQMAWVAGPVVALLMVQDQRHDVGQLRRLLHDLLAENGMPA